MWHGNVLTPAAWRSVWDSNHISFCVLSEKPSGTWGYRSIPWHWCSQNDIVRGISMPGKHWVLTLESQFLLLILCAAHWVISYTSPYNDNSIDLFECPSEHYWASSKTKMIWFPICVQDRVEVNSGHLKISNLALEDSGMYQCVAENKHGTIYFNAELRVQGEQKICIRVAWSILWKLHKN